MEIMNNIGSSSGVNLARKISKRETVVNIEDREIIPNIIKFDAPKQVVSLSLILRGKGILQGTIQALVDSSEYPKLTLNMNINSNTAITSTYNSSAMITGSTISNESPVYITATNSTIMNYGGLNLWFDDSKEIVVHNFGSSRNPYGDILLAPFELTKLRIIKDFPTITTETTGTLTVTVYYLD